MTTGTPATRHGMMARAFNFPILAISRSASISVTVQCVYYNRASRCMNKTVAHRTKNNILLPPADSVLAARSILNMVR
jgi:hypothetical protein